jgi:hypothetical protein
VSNPAWKDVRAGWPHHCPKILICSNQWVIRTHSNEYAQPRLPKDSGKFWFSLLQRWEEACRGNTGHSSKLPRSPSWLAGEASWNTQKKTKSEALCKAFRKKPPYLTWFGWNLSRPSARLKMLCKDVNTSTFMSFDRCSPNVFTRVIRRFST